MGRDALAEVRRVFGDYTRHLDVPGPQASLPPSIAGCRGVAVPASADDAGQLRDERRIGGTDLPLHPGQLRRLVRRVDIGLGRTGSVGYDGSGEIFLAFSTANTIPREAPGCRVGIDVMVEGQFWRQGSPFALIFEAVAEAAEEAALNALCQADTVIGRNGRRLAGFPVQEALKLLRG